MTGTDGREPARSLERPLRVALLHPCYWPEVRRGGERTVHDLAYDLLGAGHEVELITSHPGRTSRTVEDGLSVLRLRRPPDGWLRRRYVVDYASHVPLTYAALRLGSYDIVHALYATDALAAARWSRRTGRPSLYTHMGIPDHPGLMDQIGRLEAISFGARGCSALTVHSRAAAAAFRRWLGIDARVVYPSVALDAFAPARARATEPTIFCAAAADDPRKRVGLLVAAVERLRSVTDSVRLTLIRPRDRAIADEFARHPWIDMVNPTEDPSGLATLYGRAWVSALPSLGEAGGLVVLESLACGTPVVGSDDAVVPELIDDPRLGRVFAVDDEVALADALAASLGLAGEAETAQACRRRAEQFPTSRAASEYVSVYRELLA